MPKNYQDVEKRAIEVCEYLKTQDEPNIEKRTRVFEVRVGRLRRRFKGKSGSLFKCGGHNKALDDAAEKALCLYIDISDGLGLLTMLLWRQLVGRELSETPLVRMGLGATSSATGSRIEKDDCGGSNEG